MRIPNDTRLAELVDGIDIILGGHDHHYEVKKVPKCRYNLLNLINVTIQGIPTVQYMYVCGLNYDVLVQCPSGHSIMTHEAILHFMLFLSI